MNIKKIRDDFPILKKKINGKDIVYLDNAATSQKPLTVIDSIGDFYKNSNSNISRSVYSLGSEAEQIYIDSKKTVKNFINANSISEIVFSSGTTQSINDIARMLEDKLSQDDEIILSIAEHHANIVPWQELAKRKSLKLKFLEIDTDGYISIEQLKSFITEKTKVVTLTYVSNVLGVINPVEEIGKVLRDLNIFYIVDAAQAAPHLKIDVQKISCDFLVFSGHKICAPTGIGVMYIKKFYHDLLTPVNFGGGMIGVVEKYNSTWADSTQKFESGTPLLEQSKGLDTAIQYINKIGMNNIEKYTKKLSEYLLNKLSKLEGVIIYGSQYSNDKVSLVSFNLKNIHPHDVATFLDSHGICVRAGHLCAQPLLKHLNVSSVVRASIYFYNTLEEIDYFVDKLIETKEFFDKYEL